jgi:hypothetical protein
MLFAVSLISFPLDVPKEKTATSTTSAIIATRSAYSATSSPDCLRQRPFSIVIMAGPSIANGGYVFPTSKTLLAFILLFRRKRNGAPPEIAMFRAILSRGMVSHQKSLCLVTARVSKQSRKLIAPESKACCADVRGDCCAHARATRPYNEGSIFPGAGYEICEGCLLQTAAPLPAGIAPETRTPFLPNEKVS